MMRLTWEYALGTYNEVFLGGDEEDVECRRAELSGLLQPRPETHKHGNVIYSEAPSFSLNLPL